MSIHSQACDLLGMHQLADNTETTTVLGVHAGTWDGYCNYPLFIYIKDSCDNYVMYFKAVIRTVTLLTSGHYVCQDIDIKMENTMLPYNLKYFLIFTQRNGNK